MSKLDRCSARYSYSIFQVASPNTLIMALSMTVFSNMKTKETKRY